MNDFYGNPDANGDGQADAAWESANLTAIVPPYAMKFAWAPFAPVKAIRVHKKCAADLLAILTEIRDHYGSQAAIEAARMHLFGGCYNFRLMRGGSKLSIHSWAAAVDLDPELNAFGRKYSEVAGMMPMAVVKIFEDHGWTWGGLWRTGDAMHFQAADVPGQPRTTAAHVPAPPPAPAPAPTAPVEAEPDQTFDPTASVEVQPTAPPLPPVKPKTDFHDPVLVKSVQEQLRAKNYHAVGEADGILGERTKDAIMVFRRRNGMPPSDQIDDAFLAALTKSPPLEISEERKAAPTAEIEKKVETVQETSKGKFRAFIVMIWTAIVTAGSAVIDYFKDAWTALADFRHAITGIPWWTWAGLALAVSVFFYYNAKKPDDKAKEAFREGKIL